MGIVNTIFIMTTNYIGKIDAGVKTRSLLLNCNAAPAADYLPFAQDALTKFGGHPISDDKLLPILAQRKGCVRDIAEDMQRIASKQRERLEVNQ
jgi:hypothetical protein